MRVQSGAAHVDNCVFKCDGSGIVVCQGAELELKNSLVTGSRVSF